jgi:hypothetical protein
VRVSNDNNKLGKIRGDLQQGLAGSVSSCVSGIVGGAALFSTSKLKRMALNCCSEEQSVKPKL